MLRQPCNAPATEGAISLFGRSCSQTFPHFPGNPATRSPGKPAIIPALPYSLRPTIGAPSHRHNAIGASINARIPDHPPKSEGPRPGSETPSARRPTSAIGERHRRRYRRNAHAIRCTPDEETCDHVSKQSRHAAPICTHRPRRMSRSGRHVAREVRNAGGALKNGRIPPNAIARSRKLDPLEFRHGCIEYWWRFEDLDVIGLTIFNVTAFHSSRAIAPRNTGVMIVCPSAEIHVE
jgi:hypothetical protein